MLFDGGSEGKMQRVEVTVEELLVDRAVKDECQWENLPRRLQMALPTKEEWHRRIIQHCIKKRLQWSSCFARTVCKENEYYEELMLYLRKNLALFPYHLAEYVCRVMRVSPFRYYCDMIFEVMKSEQPYDSIPNLSAADALRLTGIGRNEFIDIMNKCRSKKIMWKLNKSIAKEHLPTQPIDFLIEPWWGLCLVNFTLDEFKKLSEDEMATIDKMCKEEANSYAMFDPDVVKGLLRRGLVYFDVPVYPDDRLKVSRLEGFVSNREQSYEDPTEELVYAIFVVSNENATVSELATTLQADFSKLQAAASFMCRLGWATKAIDAKSIFEDTNIPESPRSVASNEDAAAASFGIENTFIDNESFQRGDISNSRNYGPRSAFTRVAFVVDANITSYLMMGSVSPGLKSHAVTLYEAGKLGHASIPDLCKDLGTLESEIFEGELQEFADHAFSMRCVLECLHSGGVSTDAIEEEGFNQTSGVTSSNDESSSAVAETSANYGIAEAGTSNDESSSAIAETSFAEKSENYGITEPATNNDYLINLDSEKHVGASVSSETVPSSIGDGAHSISIGDGAHSINSEDDSSQVHESRTSDANVQGYEKVSAVEGSDVGTDKLKRKKKYRLDILRSESLATLAPATLSRLFHRDYDILVSIVPLPHSSILPKPIGSPVHFGPPTYSSMTPWMKLVLYSTAASGPLSVVLMKGQCLSLLPAPLAGCEKALLWSWDGSTVGGLGRKLEGNLVKGSILLHCLNSLLKHSAVLVLPLSRSDLSESGNVITLDIPLPFKNSDGSVASVGKELGLSELESAKLNSMLTSLANKMELWTVGYIRLLRLFNGRETGPFSPEKYEWVPLSVEFGMPLFSPKLCNNICRRVISSKLLQSGSFDEHRDAMQSLRKKLRDMCANYRSSGPAAKLLYQKEQANESSGQLVNYASGRWNSFNAPSSPISGASSPNPRLKLANRQRYQTEVLCFDGSNIRSYSLAHNYDASTKVIAEPNQTDDTNTESQENDSKEPILPGVNLLFDGSELHPFDIGACLQARLPISLIMEAATASASAAIK